VVAEAFGIPHNELHHDITFFTRMNASKTAKTVHDEYWHQHVDTEQYGSFVITTVLYLNDEGSEFEGGGFEFTKTGDVVHPTAGGLHIFSSGDENPHRVIKVTRGVRWALTSAFTCDAKAAQQVSNWPKPADIAAALKLEKETEAKKEGGEL
jgi:predicted 2-oxoglutarate/Fe(II)-dependent dioxygenase YbiX